MAHSAAYNDLRYLSHSRNLPTMAVVAVRVAATLAKWNERHVTRKSLRVLPAHLLEDVGLTSHTAHREARRWFWQGEP